MPNLYYTNATGDGLWDTLGNWNTEADGSGNIATAIPWTPPFNGGGYHDYDLLDASGGAGVSLNNSYISQYEPIVTGTCYIEGVNSYIEVNAGYWAGSFTNYAYIWPNYYGLAYPSFDNLTNYGNVYGWVTIGGISAFYVESQATSLDQSGNGYWDGSWWSYAWSNIGLDQNGTGNYSGYYRNETGTYPDANIPAVFCVVYNPTSLDSSGNGWWDGYSTYLNGYTYKAADPAYYIGGLATTLDQNGNGWWNGNAYINGVMVQPSPNALYFTNANGDDLWETLGNWNTAADGSGDTPTSIPWVGGYFDYDLHASDSVVGPILHPATALNGTGIFTGHLAGSGIINSGVYNISNSTYIDFSGTINGGYFNFSNISYPYLYTTINDGYFTANGSEEFWNYGVINGGTFDRISNGGTINAATLYGLKPDYGYGTYNFQNITTIENGIPYTGSWAFQYWQDGAWVSALSFYYTNATGDGLWETLGNWNTAFDGIGETPLKVPWVDVNSGGGYWDADLFDSSGAGITLNTPIIYNVTGTCYINGVNNYSEVDVGNWEGINFTNYGYLWGSFGSPTATINGVGFANYGYIFSWNIIGGIGAYYVNSIATTLDQNGSGYWDGTFWIGEGAATKGFIGLNENGTGWNDGTYRDVSDTIQTGWSPAYYVSGQPTTLNQNGTGFWNGNLYVNGAIVPTSANTLYYVYIDFNSWETLTNWFDYQGNNPTSVPWVDDYFDYDLVDAGGGQPFVSLASTISDSVTGTCSIPSIAFIQGIVNAGTWTGNNHGADEGEVFNGGIFNGSDFTLYNATINGGSYNINGLVNYNASIDYQNITINYDGVPYTGVWEGQNWLDGVWQPATQVSSISIAQLLKLPFPFTGLEGNGKISISQLLKLPFFIKF